MTILDDFDLTAMIEPFGIEVTAEPDTQNEFTFKAIFDKATEMYADGEVFSNTYPRLTCISADVENLTKESVVRFSNINRTIRDIKPDGWGITVVELKK